MFRFIKNGDSMETDHVIQIKQGEAGYTWVFDDKMTTVQVIQGLTEQQVCNNFYRTVHMMRWDHQPYNSIQAFFPGYPSVLIQPSNLEKALPEINVMIRTVFENWAENIRLEAWKAACAAEKAAGEAKKAAAEAEAMAEDEADDEEADDEEADDEVYEDEEANEDDEEADDDDFYKDMPPLIRMPYCPCTPLRITRTEPICPRAPKRRISAEQNEIVDGNEASESNALRSGPCFNTRSRSNKQMKVNEAPDMSGHVYTYWS